MVQFMLAAKKSCLGFLQVVTQPLQISLVFGNKIDILEEEHSDFGLYLTDEGNAVQTRTIKA